MLIEGSIKTNKSQILMDRYIELINNGVSSGEILVICLNSFKKQLFIDTIKSKTKTSILEKLNVYTFYGLCYNALLDNWPIVEDVIKMGKPAILPNLCGLEVSQYILKQSIRSTGFKDYASKINLLHQLFRRHSLIVQNCLDGIEVEKRSSILKESFKEDAKKALDNFKLLTLEHRSFDYLRQLSIFPYIYKNTDYFKNIKYLIVDDADEITYIIWEFIEYIEPQLKDVFIAYDKNGASRCGYLSAYKTSVFEFENLFNQKAIRIDTKDNICKDADTLFDNIKNNKRTFIKSIQIEDKLKRLDMIDSAMNKIKDLLDNGIQPQEINIISPIIDNALKFSLKETFALNSIKYQIISGSEKLCENSLIKAAIIILKLANPHWKLKVDPIEIRGLFINLLKIPIKYCLKITQDYKANGFLSDFNFGNDDYNLKYKSLLSTIEQIKTYDKPLSEQLLLIYENILCLKKEDLKKFNFLLKEIEGFETAFPDSNEIFKKDFVIQIENSVISENPSTAMQIESDAIIVSTPQKAIDFEVKTKYQIWLDISNSEWLKQDIGPLYNSWVFHADWNKEEFTYEDNLRLTKEKTARILRKLMLCSNSGIYCFSSLYDSLGNENFGGILEFLDSTKGNSKPITQNIITPRADQKPVLDYEKGQMGIMAVPGAGKTTILLALIVKLLENKIKAENIFVLTYMESAARNLKERIKNSYPQYIELPNISTIHGLALRIIKENSNYSRLNLADNFEICDDNERQKTIRECLLKLKLDQENYENYEKAISVIKLSADNFNLHSKYKEINNFITFFKEYNKALRQNNLIDYDDMLNLSVKLLEENHDILEYYQDTCQFIFEDEAQDSSALQQKLLSLLSGKNKNLIRCGDINQSITSTFTNSDLKDFKEFLKKSTCIEMNSSQRCAEPIYTLANNLVSFANNIPELKNAFYPISMLPTGSNPNDKRQPKFEIFEKDSDERNCILKQIRTILTQNPKATIAVLLRNNYQVTDYNSLLTNNGFKTITRTDCLGQKAVFKAIFSVIKLIQSPWNNKVLSETMTAFNEIGLISFNTEDFNYIKEPNLPFINQYCDEIMSSNLTQLFWDTNYWVNNSDLSLDDLSIKIGLHYFKTDIEKSNVYLISMLIKRLISNYKTTETIIEKLEDLSNRPLLSNYKFFNEEEENSSEIEGKINIMTVHKSKGDEFDVVFIPEITEDAYATTLETTKIKANTHFMETIKNLNQKYSRKSEIELKKTQIEENLRLLYVAITRAKKELHLSCAKSYKKRKSSKPSVLFSTFLGE